MPHFSGLQMIETLRRNGLDTEVIFISAYNRFEYAKEALRYGAFDYILKPIQEPQLLEAVQRCVEKIGNRQTQAIQDGYNDTMLAKLLTSGKQTQKNTDELLEMIGGLANPDTHAMAIGLWGALPESISPAVYEKELIIHDVYRVVPVHVREDLTVWLLFGAVEVFPKLARQWQRSQSASDPEICVTESEVVPLESAFERLLPQICFARITSLVKGISCVVFSDYERYEQDAFADSDQGRAALLDLVKTANREEVNSALYRYFLMMLKNGTAYDIVLVRLQCIDLLNRILHDPSAYHLQEYFGSQLKTLTAQKSIASCETLEEVFIATQNLLMNFAASVEDMGKRSTKRLVNLAIQYIEENYGKDISLSQVAQALYVSASYLSKVFSAEMQTTFSHFLQTHRMDVAKNLLRTTNQKIYDVASQVGYSDVVHFSKSFKQITGLSPSQYRNQ